MRCRASGTRPAASFAVASTCDQWTIKVASSGASARSINRREPAADTGGRARSLNTSSENSMSALVNAVPSCHLTFGLSRHVTSIDPSSFTRQVPSSMDGNWVTSSGWTTPSRIFQVVSMRPSSDSVHSPLASDGTASASSGRSSPWLVELVRPAIISSSISWVPGAPPAWPGGLRMVLKTVGLP